MALLSNLAVLSERSDLTAKKSSSILDICSTIEDGTDIKQNGDYDATSVR